MAKVRNPTTFSAHFGVDRGELDSIGVFDPTLAVDTKLFIDPLLFRSSRHAEIHTAGVQQYRQHFERVITFLAATRRPEDVAWRSARRLLEFHELRGTCLGYGANSIAGSGFGRDLTEQLLLVGKEIVDLGIRDPDLFPAMALLEANIGADRISDMATNVALRALVAFNRRVLEQMHLQAETFDLDGVTGDFLANPFQKRRTPIILVPRDVLRKLPIARDWDGIADAAYKTEVLRRRVNEHIGEIWAAKTRRDKARLRAQALSSREAFQALLDVIHGVPHRAYDSLADPDGLVVWARMGKEYADRFPLRLLLPRPVESVDEVHGVVRKIVSRFRQLVENNGLNRELYKARGVPRHESTAQRLFFAIAHSYCEANNLDLSPEVDSGSGEIDFKLSHGFDARVLVEVKLSTNPKVVSGYRTQLDVYKKAEETTRAVYLVIDMGKMGSKHKRLLTERNAASARGQPLSDLEFVDGKIKPSASKR
jgi:hypothetical protein